jgi:release factor glutamine methyltransferase
VLIPRADTETLVDFAVKNLPEGALFLDLCTGSGCVAISTLKNTAHTRAVAVDLSEGALEIARENAERNGVSDRIEFILGDAKGEIETGEIFALLSNPPYVADEVYEGLEGEIFHEPKMAFVGGSDGGDFYRAITPIYRDKIANDGFIAYEIGYDQAELLREIAKDNSMSCEIIKDLGGNDRVAILRIIK